jgi:hypothetical protein
MAILESPSVKNFDVVSKAVAVLLALATMLGCQSLAAVSPGQLTVSPSSMSFGNVPIGQSHSQPATLSNSGGSSLTINSSCRPERAGDYYLCPAGERHGFGQCVIC